MDEALFPVDVFPQLIQDIVSDCHAVYSYPKNYISASLLVAASIVIGNSTTLIWKPDWEVKSNLFVALVGQPGAVKSHPIKFALRPLIEYDRESIKSHNQRIRDLAPDDVEKKTSIAKQYIVKDITMEALSRVLSGNPGGIGVHRDELKGWFSSFDAYRKGSDTETWLSIYDGDPLVTNRKGTNEIIIIPEPYVSVIGGIQPAVLKRLFVGNLSDNGLFYRVIFANNDCDGTPVLWNDSVSDAHLQWGSIIANLRTLSENKRSLTPSDDARALITAWQNQKELNICKRQPYEIESFRKIQNVALKMCILVHMLNEATGVSPFSNTISQEVCRRAIDIAEYFYYNALDLYQFVNTDNNTAKLRDAIMRLPDTFSSRDALEIGLKLKYSGTSIKQYLKDNNGISFEKIGTGIYRKIN